MSDHTRYSGSVAYVAKNKRGTDRPYGFLTPDGSDGSDKSLNLWFGDAGEFKRGEKVTFELFCKQTGKSAAACRVRKEQNVDQENEF